MTPSRTAAIAVDRKALPPTGSATAIGRESSAGRSRGVAADGGLWRGLTEGPWITRLLRGALAPRDSTSSVAGRTPRDLTPASLGAVPDLHRVPRKD